MAGRPRFKPTKPQRDLVKLLKADGWSNERIARQLEIARNTLEAAFAEELEFGADKKRMELIVAAEKGAKKGNASLIKWLQDRYDVARAADQVAGREQQPAPTEVGPRPEPKRGKKEQQQQAAEEVTGKFAPPPPPKLH